MRFGGEYRFEKVQAAELALFAAEVGVRPRFVKDTMLELIDAAATAREGVASTAELSDAQSLVRQILEAWDTRSRTLTEYL